MPPSLLLTRPQPASRRFLAQVAAVAGPVSAVISPLIEIAILPVDLPDLPLSGLILTSENGAAAAARLNLPNGLKAWCVGAQTARAAQAAGFVPVSADADAESLVRLILASGTVGPLLHLRGEHVRGDVAGRLSASGIVVTETVAYRQIECPLSDEARDLLAGPTAVVAPVFSPRTVSILADSGPLAAKAHLVAISAAAASAAPTAAWASVAVAASPDGQAMVRATCDVLERLGTA